VVVSYGSMANEKLEEIDLKCPACGMVGEADVSAVTTLLPA